ncbi:MAG: nucleoside triphosphate pyrophosphohydrolase, partial [Actinomycetia bacterium]|nr:nucleoside triphosphate pyrophosphohydrolase [Actinomycetes bacterium]
IARAMKVQKRARSVGFDWEHVEDVIEALRGEIDELIEARPDAAATAGELGDILFTAVNLARHVEVDPEIALRGSVDTFIERFRSMEAAFDSRSVSIRDATLEELEAAWSEAKSALR